MIIGTGVPFGNLIIKTFVRFVNGFLNLGTNGIKFVIFEIYGTKISTHRACAIVSLPCV